MGGIIKYNNVAVKGLQRIQRTGDKGQSRSLALSPQPAGHFHYKL